MSNPNHDPSNGQFTSSNGGGTTKQFVKNPNNPLALKEKIQEIIPLIPPQVDRRGINLPKAGQIPDNLARANAGKLSDILDKIKDTETKRTLYKGFEAKNEFWASEKGLSSNSKGQNGRHCTDFIKYVADGIGSSSTWRAGSKIDRDILDSLEIMTIIATFTTDGDDAKYGVYVNKPSNPGSGSWQHTAVVVGTGMGKDRGGKEAYGVWVVDQYAGSGDPSDDRLDYRFIAIDELQERNYRQVKSK